ncbi:MAG: flavodoxin family protein [Deltaproteobacteria bacterium]|nr:flavodoxin family protein [Nannocystaceae bacterium]
MSQRSDARVVKGQPDVHISEVEFRRRLRERFDDPAFAAVERELDAIVAVAHDGYEHTRKSPRTRKAGPGYADPDYDLSLDWLAAKRDIEAAADVHTDPEGPPRVLLISGSPRHDQTCPGELPKSYRLVELAREELRASGFEIDVLDLGRLTAEYGRSIHPCKGCVSTSMPLCHWPCSCYPNHALGQVQDWMNEIYPRWVTAHGVMIVTPVHWLSVPSVLKLMIDRLVCADGGNTDPTRTGGKDPAKAKAIELDGWDYPKHLAGRAFSVIVHGDAEGVDAVKDALCTWLTTLGLVQAGPQSVVARYLGYLQPYATGHAELDRDAALQQEVRNAAASLGAAVQAIRRGEPPSPMPLRPDPRPK